MPKITFDKNRLMPAPITIDAKPGLTLLEAAEAVGIPVGANCGGVCGCSTCHVVIKSGEDELSEMEDREADRLDMAFDVRLESRLACQAVLGDEEVEVQITEESLAAFLDENPKQKKHFEATGELLLIPHGH